AETPPPQITMLRCADMESLTYSYSCPRSIAGRNRFTKQGRRIDFTALRRIESIVNVQKPDRPACHPRPRTARGEFVPRQQPEDELAARVRRPGDRPGHGGGVPHRRGTPA